MPDDLDVVRRYHDGTKHHFNRFARALGYLDWASQPRPFRSFDDAPIVSLFDRTDEAALSSAQPTRGSSDGFDHWQSAVSYDQLYSSPGSDARPIGYDTIGMFLRYALGLSAWKVFRDSRWALRVNPSSGNLHPTEAYVIAGAIGGLGTPGRTAGDEGQRALTGTVWHYAPDRHVIERRCEFAAGAWPVLGIGEPADAFLVALTSIHWRESWKYGERAFRYCQHDLGHAVAALRLSAAMQGWRAAMLPSWSHRGIATVTGIDRDEDYSESEREEPACLLVVTSGATGARPAETPAFIEAVRGGQWSGRASQLSEDHVQWTFIDEVAAATSDDGRATGQPAPAAAPARGHGNPSEGVSVSSHWGWGPGASALMKSSSVAAAAALSGDDRGLDAAAIILQRRSALALDGVTSIGRDGFLRILDRLLPRAAAPWDALWWTPRIHLALFVHRVDGMAPGLYLLPRSAAALPALRGALSTAFLWEQVAATPALWLLERGECRARATRVSCDQTIAGDGFFSLGMIAEFDGSLSEQGPAFYRQLFWESGVVGQVLYLEAEAAGARGTGIGCFYDDAVHELLGLRDRTFQSLYHFTMGAAVEDSRLTTEAAYRRGSGVGAGG